MKLLSSRTVLARVGWLPFALTIVAVLVTSIAGITWNTSPYYGRDNRAPRAEVVADVPTSHGVYDRSVAPNRVVIPKLDATAPIVDIGTDSNRELDIPLNPKIVGWWSPGAKPGASTGTAVLAGHINYAGVNGTLGKIGKLEVGDDVDVYGKFNAGGAGKIGFRVTAVRTYHKTHLPYQQIFDQKIAGRLALVTCGGPFDASTGNYLDNIVVYAVPTGSSAS